MMSILLALWLAAPVSAAAGDGSTPTPREVRELLTARAKAGEGTSEPALEANPAGAKPVEQTRAPRRAPRTKLTCAENQIWIRGGTFTMGDDHLHRDSRPEHRVTLSPFCMDKTEVTAAAFKACVESGKCKKPRREGGPHYTYGVEELKEHPMNCVYWHEACK